MIGCRGRLEHNLYDCESDPEVNIVRYTDIDPVHECFQSIALLPQTQYRL